MEMEMFPWVEGVEKANSYSQSLLNYKKESDIEYYIQTSVTCSECCIFEGISITMWPNATK
jgi:hypothetical protein